MMLKLLLLAALATTPLLAPGCLEASAFYHPEYRQSATPAGFEDVRFPTTDGLTLHGWFIPARGRAPGAGPAPTVLHVHGNSGDVGAHRWNCEFLADRGFNVLVFDYRGYGTSDPPRGILRRDALVEDTGAALDYLATRHDVDHTRIAVFGYSLGGALGLAAAAEHPEVRAVVSFATFSTWKGVAADHAGFLGRALIPAGEDAVTSVGRLGDRALLIVHGTRDGIVRFRHAGLIRDAAEKASVEVDFVEVDGGNHLTLAEDPAVQDRVEAFLRRSMAME